MSKDIPLTILELLATYIFLCPSQLLELLDYRISRKTLYAVLKSLREKERALIGRRIFRFRPVLGRVEDIYYLLPKWKKYLVREHRRNEDNIRMPIGNTRFYNDYRHRRMTIDVHIMFCRTAEQQNYSVAFYDHYFQGRKKTHWRGRESATHIDLRQWSIRADSIVLLSDPNGKQHLICIEIHRGQRVKKIEEQLKKHAQAIALGSPSTKYCLQVGNKVLTVFEYESTLNSLTERVTDDPLFRHLKGHFIHTTYSMITSAPSRHVRDLDGRPHTLFS